MRSLVPAAKSLYQNWVTWPTVLVVGVSWGTVGASGLPSWRVSSAMSRMGRGGGVATAVRASTAVGGGASVTSGSGALSAARPHPTSSKIKKTGTTKMRGCPGKSLGNAENRRELVRFAEREERAIFLCLSLRLLCVPLRSRCVVGRKKRLVFKKTPYCRFLPAIQADWLTG